MHECEYRQVRAEERRVAGGGHTADERGVAGGRASAAMPSLFASPPSPTGGLDARGQAAGKDRHTPVCACVYMLVRACNVYVESAKRAAKSLECLHCVDTAP